MTLQLENITKEFDNVVAAKEISLSVDNDDFLVLLGPSGSGKSTTLRIIAGLESATRGDVLIDDTVVNEKKPADRNIAMVFQDYALYPHMTARENMALSLKVQGMPKQQISERVEQVSEVLGILELTERRPANMSGGQQQRVALGRAMVRNPSVFLLDEPLSNLDAKLRIQMRKELIQLHEQLETTFVYVTHDQVEAMTMATKIAVLDQGELQQVGTPEELYDKPANEFVAEFIGDPGMNLFDCELVEDQGVVVADLGQFRYPLSDGVAEAARRIDSTSRIQLGVRPENVVLGNGRFEASLSVTELTGSDMLAYLDKDGTEILAETERDAQFAERDIVRFDFSEDNVHLFSNGERISR